MQRREGIYDKGWTDTVLFLPGETVRVQVTFSTFPGRCLSPCHILGHEDMVMMPNFRIRLGNRASAPDRLSLATPLR